MAPTVHFFLRGRRSASPEQLCAIYASIEFDGETCGHFSLKIKIPSKYWLVERNSGIKRSTTEYPVSPSYSLADELNQQLTEIRKSAYQAAREVEMLEQPLSAATIKEQLLNPQPIMFVRKFADVMDELIAKLGTKRKDSTMLTYRTRRNNLEEFLVANCPRLMIHQFSFNHFEMLHEWMISQLNDDGSRRWCRNTINKHLTAVNKTLNYAVNKKYIKYNPVGEMDLEYDETAPPEYLLPKHRKAIYHCDLQTLEKERDISIFLYNTGLSYTDYLTLDNSHVSQLESGEWFLKKQRDKSSVYSIIPLLPEAQEIVSKYGCVANLPRPDISDLNKVLKILADVCKVPFDLSTSTFRETFASMMENEFMVQTRTLMYMMGHTNERQLRNYSSVMPARVLHELKKENVVIPLDLTKFHQIFQAS